MDKRKRTHLLKNNLEITNENKHLFCLKYLNITEDCELIFDKVHQREDHEKVLKIIKKSVDKIGYHKDIILNIIDNIIFTGKNGATLEKYKMYYGKFAEDLYKKYTNSTSGTIENFIKRHGEEKGKKKFEEFKRKSTHTKENMTEEKWSYYISTNACYSGNRPNNTKYWIKKGLSVEEAKIKVSEFQNTTSLESYIRKLGKVEGLKRYKEVCKLKNCRRNKTEEEIDKINRKIRKTNEEKGLWMLLEHKSDYERYINLVLYYTRKTVKDNYFENQELRGRSDSDTNAHHLDHKYSIKQGFMEGVLPYIIGSKNNLEFIHYSINCSKRADCSIALEELLN